MARTSKDSNKLPYRITRTETEEGYLYDLWLVDGTTDEYLDHVISMIRSKAPVAPGWMRAMQAKLNTRIVMDYNGVIPADLIGRRA